MKNPGIEMSDAATHWQNVWTAKQPEEVSWHQDDPASSLAMIAAAGLRKDAAIVDVGGGASVLVEEARQDHVTPGGSVQKFQWARFVRG